MRGRKATFIIKNREYKGKKTDGRRVKNEKNKPGGYAGADASQTISRNCFSRVVGAYFDEEGYVDGTFNIHFLKLSKADQGKNLKLAKAIPFADTNRQLKEYVFPETAKKPGSIWQLLMALKECELKNDGLLETFYEILGEKLNQNRGYGFYLFYGCYDVPRKGNDKTEQWESEEVYPFLTGVFAPVSGDYEMGEPQFGFLFPAFSDRSGDPGAIAWYEKNADRPHEEFLQLLQLM